MRHLRLLAGCLVLGTSAASADPYVPALFPRQWVTVGGYAALMALAVLGALDFAVTLGELT